MAARRAKKPSRFGGSVSVDADQIRSSLGPIEVSEAELQDLAIALRQHHRSILRRRVGVSAQRLVEMAPEISIAESVPWYSLANQLDEHADSRPSQSLAYAAGEFFLQDAGSLLALAACEADRESLRGKIVCDLCAAPGAKASALAEAVGDDGFVLANEVIRGRVPALSFNLSRTGSDRWAISGLDPSELAERLGGVFDCVLVDAPCSGQALLSRGKQNDSALSQKQILHSAQRQRRILDAACGLLRPGGNLVYSTCTFAHQENEAQVNELIERNELQPQSVERLAEYESPIAPASYRLWPHRHGCAGGFAASLVHPAGSPSRTDEGFLRKRRERPLRLPIDGKPWLRMEADDDLSSMARFSLEDASLVAWSLDAPSWVESVAKIGPELAHRTGRTWKPSHALARRRGGGLRANQFVEVDDSAARAFLRGQAIPLDVEGWAVVLWQDRPLGWVKGNRTIGKNHLPIAARLSGS